MAVTELDMISFVDVHPREKRNAIHQPMTVAIELMSLARTMIGVFIAQKFL